MTKKILMGALLVSSLLISSCVKEQETQTVTDLRNAKAEQLSARAALNNAKAQAAQIAATADAALIEAKAKAEEAAAAKLEAETTIQVKQNELAELRIEYAKLEVEAQKIQNQQAQVALEQAIMDLEVVKAQAERDLEAIAAQMEVSLLEFAARVAYEQRNLYIAQRELFNYETWLEDEANRKAYDELLALSSEYSTALDKLYSKQQAIINLKNDIIKLENDIIDLDEFKTQQIADLNEKISNEKAKIAIYENYSDDLKNIDNLDDTLNELRAKVGLLTDSRYKINKSISEFVYDWTEFDRISDEIDNDDFYKFIIGFAFNGYRSSKLDALYKDYAGIDETFFANAHDSNAYIGGTYIYKPFEKDKHSASILTSYEFIVERTGTWLRDRRTVQVRIDELLTFIKEDIKANTKTIAEYQANYNGVATGYYETVGAPLTVYAEDAAKKLNAIQRAAAAKEAYYTEPTPENEAAYRTAVDVENWLAGLIPSLQTQLEDSGNLLAFVETYSDFCKNYEEHVEELTDAIDELNAATIQVYAPRLELQKEYYLINWDIEDANAEINAINSILTNTNMIKGYITTCEQNIAVYEKEITRISDDTSKEDSLETSKLRLEALEVELNLIQVELDTIKATLDALLEDSTLS